MTKSRSETYELYRQQFKDTQNAYRENNSLERSIRKHKSDKVKLKQENRRLREALQTIRDNHAMPHDHRQGTTTNICEQALSRKTGNNDGKRNTQTD